MISGKLENVITCITMIDEYSISKAVDPLKKKSMTTIDLLTRFQLHVHSINFKLK